MSFADEVDLEAQMPYSDSPEFDRLAEDVATGLFDINSNIITLQRLLKSLSKPGDVATEERAINLADDTRHKVRELSDSVKSLQKWPDCAAAQKFTQQKLSREFQSALLEFQGLQRDLAQTQRASVIWAKSDLAAHPDIHDSLVEPAEQAHHAEQTQLLDTEEQLDQQEVEYQQALITEREAEIQGIEQGIEELNEIFTDLSTIVTEQGTIIDNIEANIYSIAQSTRDASSELVKAARYQRNSRGRALCLLIILVIILAVILLGVFVG